jgi:hypothetical protein
MRKFIELIRALFQDGAACKAEAARLGYGE